MNFFGHAAVASWRSPAPAFVLGAMLPDFASMIRARLPKPDHDALARGVRFHHVTDDAFHDAPSFRALSARAFEALGALGVARPSARAVAHIGVEILLDGVLASEAPARSAYLDALGARRPLAPHFGWTTERDHGAFFELTDAIEARGLRHDHASPEMVAFRVSRALAGRPRLRLSREDEPRVLAWAERAKPEVEARASTLLTEVRMRLGAELA